MTNVDSTLVGSTLRGQPFIVKYEKGKILRCCSNCSHGLEEAKNPVGHVLKNSCNDFTIIKLLNIDPVPIPILDDKYVGYYCPSFHFYKEKQN